MNKVCQTDLEPCGKSTPNPRKQPRGPTESPEKSATGKPEEKRPKALKQSEEWVKVPIKKNLCKKKPKPVPRKPERSKRASSKAVVIKPSKGVRCAAIMKNLKSRVNPEELGVVIGGIRETRTKDLLVEVKCTAKDRGRLDFAFRHVVEVENLDIDPTAEADEVAEAVRGSLWEEPSSDWRKRGN